METTEKQLELIHTLERDNLGFTLNEKLYKTKALAHSLLNRLVKLSATKQRSFLYTLLTEQEDIPEGLGLPVSKEIVKKVLNHANCSVPGFQLIEKWRQEEIDTFGPWIEEYQKAIWANDLGWNT